MHERRAGASGHHHHQLHQGSTNPPHIRSQPGFNSNNSVVGLSSSTTTTKLVVGGALVLIVVALLAFVLSAGTYSRDDGLQANNHHLPSRGKKRQLHHDNDDDQQRQRQRSLIVDGHDSVDHSSQVAETPSPTTTASTSTTTTTSTSVPTTTPRPTASAPRGPPTWSMKSRIFCTDFDDNHSISDSHRNVNVFDYRLTMFHVCQLHHAWILGSWGWSSESRGQILVIFPPSEADTRRDMAVDGVVNNHYPSQRAAKKRSRGGRSNNNDDDQRVATEKSKAHEGDGSKSDDGDDDGDNLHDKQRTTPPTTTKHPLIQQPQHQQFIPFEKRRFAFPVTPFNTRFVTIVESQDELALNRERRLHKHKHAITMTPGVTLVVPPHYCCKHPMHFMEPIGALVRALDRWLEPRPKLLSASLLTNADGQPQPQQQQQQQQQQQTNLHHQHAWRHHRRCPRNESLQCFREIDRVLVYAASGVNENNFNWHVLRALLFGAYKRAGFLAASSFKIPISSLSMGNHMYERLVVPGALYDVFPDARMGTRFRDDFRSYMQYRRDNGMAVLHQQTKFVYGGGAKMNSSTSLPPSAADVGHHNNDDNNGVINNQKKDNTNDDKDKDGSPSSAAHVRKVVFTARQSGRTITDQEEFVDFLGACARLVNASIVSVRAGETPTDLLYNKIGDAKVMIGLHGADLANIIFLPAGSAMVEMNPMYFFEPRFFDLAKKFNYSYHAWNCRSPSCAFGGNEVMFYANIPDDLIYNVLTGEMRSKANRSLVATWPATGYVGESCGQPCLQLIHDTGLGARFFTALRGSSVRTMAAVPGVGGRQPQEIAGVVFDAFIAVGWAVENERAHFMKRLFRRSRFADAL